MHNAGHSEGMMVSTWKAQLIRVTCVNGSTDTVSSTLSHQSLLWFLHMKEYIAGMVAFHGKLHDEWWEHQHLAGHEPLDITPIPPYNTILMPKMACNPSTGQCSL